MNKFFFLSALFISSIFSSATAISFIDEQTKIMTAFNNLSALNRFRSDHCSFKDHKDYFKPLLELDPLIFLEEMSKVTDKIFLFTFWNTFNSIYLFVCNCEFTRKTRKEYKDFLAQVHLSDTGLACTTDMLYHFKIYLIEAIATCQADSVQNMLLEAENFYTLRLKEIILEVLNRPTDTLNEEIEKMYQNFRFYHQCTEKDNLKHMLTREYRMLKIAMKSNNKKLIRIHAENMTFIAGILKYDRSTIYGLNLIADQSPEFVGFFLLMQSQQVHFLCRPSISEDELEIYRNSLLSYLNGKIPVFEYHSREINNHQKFMPLNVHIKEYEGILTTKELIALAKTLFRKIISI